MVRAVWLEARLNWGSSFRSSMELPTSETTTKETGEPVYNAIGWQIGERLFFAVKQSGLTEKIRSKTGLVIEAFLRIKNQVDTG
jgi:hypothetical protein